MAVAERAYERSLRAHCSMDIDLTWLRAGDPGYTGWAFQPDGKTRASLPYRANPRQWATQFTCFRYAVPEFAGFQGRAIWTDVDMIVLGDMAELWNMELKKPWACVSHKRTDVSVIDAGAFYDLKGWPSVEFMRTHGVSAPVLRAWLVKRGLMECSVPPVWDHCDRYKPGKSKLVHFTNMFTQPWKPWPERFDYRQPHPDPGAVDLFWKWANADD